MTCAFCDLPSMVPVEVWGHRYLMCFSCVTTVGFESEMFLQDDMIGGARVYMNVGGKKILLCTKPNPVQSVRIVRSLCDELSRTVTQLVVTLFTPNKLSINQES